jgi:hypothetical protein
MFDKGVAHFDVYGQLGGGQIELKSGKTSTYIGGLGIGFWISKHLTTRLEMNFQNYKTQRVLGDSNMNLTLASLQIGYLL